MENDRILVIDDDPGVVELLATLIRDEGYALQSTSDSRQALALLQAVPFDLVISDIVMPHRTGLEILEAAKRQNPDVEVLLVTAYATSEVARDALAKGACGLLAKPFDRDQFRAAFHEALFRSHYRRGITA